MKLKIYEDSKNYTCTVLKVCRMWYDLNLFVFNCNQGLIEF